MKLTKARVVDQISKEIGLPKNESTEVVETLIEVIKSTLESGEDILISGFGKFCVNEKNERRGRNPVTGDEMMLKPRRVVTFRCSRNLRDKINQGITNQGERHH